MIRCSVACQRAATATFFTKSRYLSTFVALCTLLFTACVPLLRYDPVHYGVPEGSYSTAPDGPLRVLEFREMVQVGHAAAVWAAAVNAAFASARRVMFSLIPCDKDGGGVLQCAGRAAAALA